MLCISLRKRFSVILDQRKLKLKTMEREEDLDAVIAKLVDAAANLNIQRFQSAMEIKVNSFRELVVLGLFKT